MGKLTLILLACLLLAQTYCRPAQPFISSGTIDISPLLKAGLTRTMYNRTFATSQFRENYRKNAQFVGRPVAAVCFGGMSQYPTETFGLFARVIEVKETWLIGEISHHNLINNVLTKINYYVADQTLNSVRFSQPCDYLNRVTLDTAIEGDRIIQKCQNSDQQLGRVYLFISGLVIKHNKSNTSTNQFGGILGQNWESFEVVEVWRVVINTNQFPNFEIKEYINVEFTNNQYDSIKSEQAIWGFAYFPADHHIIKQVSLAFTPAQPAKSLRLLILGVTCAYKCGTCDPNPPNNCLTCSDPATRLISTQCLCIDGTFDSGTPTCPACHYTCLLCDIAATNCTSCNATLHRDFPSSMCPCVVQYFENSSLLCEMCDSTCNSCSVQPTNCTQCAGSLTKIDAVLGICGCAAGQYISGSNACTNCDYKCATCSGSATNCLTCPASRNSSTAACACNDGYYDSGSATCSSCDIPCATCSGSATNCLTCPATRNSSTSACACNDGYYDSGSSACSSCDPTCATCNNPSNCQSCPPSRVKQGSNCNCPDQTYTSGPDCISCHYSCYNCSSSTSTTCTSCPASSNRALSSSSCPCNPGFCDVGVATCSSCHYSCVTCTNTSSTGCAACPATRTLQADSSCLCKERYFDPSALDCVACHYSCYSCPDASTCSSCSSKDHRTLTGTSCPCQPGYYDDGSSQTCPICHYSCLSCTTGSACTSCEPTNFRANLTGGALCDCQPGTYDVADLHVCPNCSDTCLTCTGTATNCQTCKNNQNRNQQGSTCVCDTGYGDGSELSPPSVDISAVCYEICGDGLIFVLPCDDGNTVSGDGCSSTCQVEDYFTCAAGAPSVCNLNIHFSFTQVSITKDPQSNTAIITYSVTPNVSQLSTSNISLAFSSSLPGCTFLATYSPSSSQLTLNLSYSSSLQGQTATITFDPSSLTMFVNVLPNSNTITFDAENNLPFAYYPDSVYSGMKIITYVGYVVVGLALATFIGLFVFNKLISVEVMAVLQAAYIGLLMVGEMPVMLIGFSGMYYVNGYNYLRSYASNFNERLYFMGLSPSFLRNFNVMIMSIALPLLVGSMMKCRQRSLRKTDDGQQLTQIRKKHYQKIKKYAQIILYEITFTFVLFNLIYGCACIGIEGVYGVLQIEQMAYSVIFCLCFLAVAIFGVVCFALPSTHDHYGCYANSFSQKNWATRNFYLFVWLQRVLLGLLIGLTTASSSVAYIVPTLPLALLLLLAILRPFNDTLHNIRSICNQFITTFILAFYTLLRIGDSSLHDNLTQILVPVEIALLVVCVVGNLALGVYEEYRRRVGAKRKQEEQKEVKHNKVIELIEYPVQLMDLDHLAREFAKIKLDQLKNRPPEATPPEDTNQKAGLLKKFTGESDIVQKPRISELENFQFDNQNAQLTKKQISQLRFTRKSVSIVKKKQQIKLESQMHKEQAGEDLAPPNQYQIKIIKIEQDNNILNQLNASHIQDDVSQSPSILDMPLTRTNINQVYRPEAEQLQHSRDEDRLGGHKNILDVTTRQEMSRRYEPYPEEMVRNHQPEELVRAPTDVHPLNETNPLETSMLTAVKKENKHLNRSGFTVRSLFKKKLEEPVKFDPENPDDIRKMFDAI